MKNIVVRLKRLYLYTVRSFNTDKQFSVKLAFYRLFGDFFGRAGLKTPSLKYHNKKDKYILDYLLENIGPVIERYQNVKNLGEKVDRAPIWICWWTGLDSAPQLVKQCVRSVQHQAGNHPVLIISKDNYSSYLQIPTFILNKMKSGKMCLAHFSDYLRVCLLNQYGGLWLDATIFCSNRIPEWYFDLPLFTCKSEYQQCGYLSHMQWTTFCLGGWKSNVFYAFLQEAFELYWKKNDYAIDYLFFDNIIWLAKEQIPAIKQLLENVPMNTPHRDDLQAAFNAILPAEAFESVICDDTPVNKLSWRESYHETTDDGQLSVYGYFLRMPM